MKRVILIFSRNLSILSLSLAVALTATGSAPAKSGGRGSAGHGGGRGGSVSRASVGQGSQASHRKMSGQRTMHAAHPGTANGRTRQPNKSFHPQAISNAHLAANAKSKLPTVATSGAGGAGGAKHWQTLQKGLARHSWGQIARYCHKVRCTPGLHWGFSKWCNYFPARCHWWYNWCGPRYYFDPTCCVSYDWYYIPCQVISTGAVVNDAWHLGLNCIYIPDRGLGVQSVQAGSPAELAGLTPGMVLLTANGQSLQEEGVMASVIANSAGILQLTALPDADAEPITITMQMTRVTTQSY